MCSKQKVRLFVLLMSGVLIYSCRMVQDPRPNQDLSEASNSTLDQPISSQVLAAQSDRLPSKLTGLFLSDDQAFARYVEVDLIPFRTYKEQSVYKGYVRIKTNPNSTEILAHEYYPVITYRHQDKQLVFSKLERHVLPIDILQFEADPGNWKGQVQKELNETMSVSFTWELWADLNDFNLRLSAEDLRFQPSLEGMHKITVPGSPEHLLIISAFRDGDPATGTQVWPVKRLAFFQEACRDLIGCNEGLVPLPLDEFLSTGNWHLPGVSKQLSISYSPESGLHCRDCELKAEKGVLSADYAEIARKMDSESEGIDIEWVDAGEYFGVLHHQNAGKHQYLRFDLRRQGKMEPESENKASPIADKKFYKANLTLFMGELGSPVFVVHPYSLQRYLGKSISFSFDGEKAESFLVVRELSQKTLVADYYSKNFGYIGELKAWRGGLGKLSDSLKLVQGIPEDWQTGNCRFRLKMESSVTSGYYSLFNPVSVSGKAECQLSQDNVSNLRTTVIDGLWYDYYHGRLSLSSKGKTFSVIDLGNEKIIYPESTINGF